MSFSDKLNSLLQQRNMSPAELARRTGISKGAISRYLADGEPVWAYAVIIADALDVSLDTLAERNPKNARTAIEILETCNRLNHKGQKKVLDYSQDLVSTGRYSKEMCTEDLSGREDPGLRAVGSAG